jgi:hypothetical protein
VFFVGGLGYEVAMAEPRRDDFPNHSVGDLVRTERGCVVVPPTACPDGHDYGQPGWSVSSVWYRDLPVLKAIVKFCGARLGSSPPDALWPRLHELAVHRARKLAGGKHSPSSRQPMGHGQQQQFYFDKDSLKGSRGGATLPNGQTIPAVQFVLARNG